MKKLSIFASLLLGLIAFTACSTDRDDNPALVVPEGGFALYNPGIAANVIDLDATSELTFKCNQPDYGYTAPVTYLMQFSVDGVNWTELPTTLTDPNHLLVDGNELAVLITNALVEQGKLEEDFPMTTDVYARARAFVTGLEETTSIHSAVTSFRAFTSFALPAVTLPETIYFCGGFNGWNWETATKGVQQHGQPEKLWRVIYIDDQGFKFNVNPAWDGGEVGFSQLNSITGSLADNITDNGGNISTTQPGWYLAIITVSLQGRTFVYDAAFEPVELYLMGPCMGDGNWSSYVEEYKFPVPSGNTEFVSPAFTVTTAGAEGDCVRAYIRTGLGDWWQSEFIVIDGKINYRGAGDDQERVGGNAGQHLYLNFSTDAGRIG